MNMRTEQGSSWEDISLRLPGRTKNGVRVRYKQVLDSSAPGAAAAEGGNPERLPQQRTAAKPDVLTRKRSLSDVAGSRDVDADDRDQIAGVLVGLRRHCSS